VNKEILKVMATNISKFVAVIGSYFAVTVGTAFLANYLYGWGKQEVFLSTILLSAAAIGVWAAYDYAKWKVDLTLNLVTSKEMGMFEDVRKELEESVQRVLDKCDAIIAKLDEMERTEMESEAREADYNG